MTCKPTRFPNGIETSCLLFSGDAAQLWPKFETVTAADSPVIITGGVLCYAADCTGGDITFILPSTLQGNYNIKKVDASVNVAVIDAGTNGNTIDDLATRNVTGQYDSVFVNSNTTQWLRQ